MTFPAKRESCNGSMGSTWSENDYQPSKRMRTPEEECNSTSHAPVMMDDGDYECSICCDLLVDPVVGACGHDFCATCLDKWRAVSNNPKGVQCPICRQVVMPPGVLTLGVCRRLKNLVERLYPERSAQRRKEIQEQQALDMQRQYDMNRHMVTVDTLVQIDTVRQAMQRSYQHMMGVFMQTATTAQAQATLSLTAATSAAHLPTLPILPAFPIFATNPMAMAMPSAPSPPFPTPTPTSSTNTSSPESSPESSEDTSSPRVPASHPSAAPLPSPTRSSSSLPSSSPSPASHSAPSAAARSPQAAHLSNQSWHSPERDLRLRQGVARKLVEMFHNRRPDMDPTFRARLPDFVRRLEESLYRSAASRAAYAEPSTLEQRVQGLARRLIQRKSGEAVAAAAARHVSSLWPRPAAQEQGGEDPAAPEC